MSDARTIWQIWAGPGSGAFAETFLRHGVALIGPEGPGVWRPDRRDEDYLDDQGNGGVSIRRLASEAKAGDVVLLRTGVQTLRAVGLIAGEYEYIDRFDDVNGWDLPHARRVRWFRLPDEYDFGRPVFAGRHRFARVQVPDVLDYARRFVDSPPIAWQTAPLPDLPDEEPALTEMPDQIAALVGLAQDLHGLYWSTEYFGERPREDELVGHFVIPLLRALGWPPERIAVKWRDVDVATFHELPRDPKHCSFIVEAKRPGGWPEDALAQARGYLDDMGVACNVVLTDGIRYHVCAADRGFERIAYANLARPRQSATRVFELMTRS